MKLMQSKPPVLLFALIPLLLSAFITAAAVILLRSDTAPTTNQIVLSCGVDQTCLTNALIKQMDSRTVLDVLSSVGDISDATGISCHTITHAVGKSAFTELGAKVFKVHESLCGNGFTHGWMVALAESSSTDATVNRLTSYCASDPNPVACYHGVGHALAEIKASGTKAVSVCTRVTAGSVDSSRSLKTPTGGCIEGWVMEGDLDSLLTSLSTDLPLTYCDGVTIELQPFCSGMTLRRWVEAAPSDRVTRALAFSDYCSNLSGNSQSLCYRYFGESVAHIVPGQIRDMNQITAAANQLCTTGDTSECINGLLSALAGDRVPPGRIQSTLCAKLNSPLSTICTETLPRYISST